ncbi:MAG: hypothetical protein CMI54_07720 [Parcubacteria group bacterium]|nr:hypothetical protein [Parcubacteria group bacterium]|tara:strand:+ start:10812 stop:11258 length:447 start_codon:yes stop_codon:yes gene_type:complete
MILKVLALLGMLAIPVLASNFSIVNATPNFPFTRTLLRNVTVSADIENVSPDRITVFNANVTLPDGNEELHKMLPQDSVNQSWKFDFIPQQLGRYNVTLTATDNESTTINQSGVGFVIKEVDDWLVTTGLLFSGIIFSFALLFGGNDE